VEHTRKVRGAESEKIAVFQAAAAEMWLFSLTHYQIVTRTSGFGRIGSFMSGRWHQLYAVGWSKKSGRRTESPQNRSCSARDFDTDEFMQYM